jgi:hypothetical protein
MNIKRGLFRLWIATSACWMIFSGLMLWSDGAFSKLVHREMTIKIEGVGKVSLGDEFNSMSEDAQNKFVMHIVEESKKGIKSGQSKSGMFDDIIADNTKEIKTGQGKSGPWDDYATRATETKTWVNSSEPRPTSIDWPKLASVTGIIAIPPSFVLLTGFVVLWVIRGFRSDREA